MIEVLTLLVALITFLASAYFLLEEVVRPVLCLLREWWMDDGC